jgi:KDO2-lipid IV(A) lauroyltransferase
MRPGKRFRRWATYRLASGSLWILNRVSRAAAQAFGAWVGLAAWALLPKHRYSIFRHLTLVYGSNLSRSEKILIGRRFFINSGRNLADLLRFREHFEDEIKPLISVEGLEHYHEAFRQGRGVVGVTGHIGNFELLAARLAQEGQPIAVIAREMYDRRLNELLVSNREAVGLKNISTSESPRVALQWLKRNGGLGVLIDTDSVRVRGEFVNWFGRPAYTPIGQTLLGLRTDSVFLPMACVRRPDGGYHVIIKQQVNIQRTHDIEADARRLTAACVRELEDIIDHHRDQWIWLHNRWHTRPGEESA